MKKPLRFVQLLNSRIRKGAILSAQQIENNRIIEFKIMNPLSSEVFYLYIRLWENRSNIILTDQDRIILGLLFTQYKNERTGEEFIFPTPRKDFKASINIPYLSSSFNESARDFFNEERKEKEYKELLKKALSKLQKELKQLKSKENNLKKNNPVEKEKLYRSWADTLISTNKGEIPPKEIIIKDNLSLIKNAQYYYQICKRLKQERELYFKQLNNLAQKITEIEKEIINLQDWSFQKLQEFLTIKPHYYSKENNEKKYFHHFILKEYSISIGRNAKENDSLIRNHSKGNDFWLHLEDYPSPHLIIHNPKRNESISLNILLDCGQLLLHYSKIPEASIYYTQVKYLHKLRKGSTSSQQLGKIIPSRGKAFFLKGDKILQEKLLKEKL